jgi:hypothetical protein
MMIGAIGVVSKGPLDMLSCADRIDARSQPASVARSLLSQIVPLQDVLSLVWLLELELHGDHAMGKSSASQLKNT